MSNDSFYTGRKIRRDFQQKEADETLKEVTIPDTSKHSGKHLDYVCGFYRLYEKNDEATEKELSQRIKATFPQVNYTYGHYGMLFSNYGMSEIYRGFGFTLGAFCRVALDQIFSMPHYVSDEIRRRINDIADMDCFPDWRSFEARNVETNRLKALDKSRNKLNECLEVVRLIFKYNRDFKFVWNISYDLFACSDSTLHEEMKKIVALSSENLLVAINFVNPVVHANGDIDKFNLRIIKQYIKPEYLYYDKSLKSNMTSINSPNLFCSCSCFDIPEAKKCVGYVLNQRYHGNFTENDDYIFLCTAFGYEDPFVELAYAVKRFVEGSNLDRNKMMYIGRLINNLAGSNIALRSFGPECERIEDFRLQSQSNEGNVAATLSKFVKASQLVYGLKEVFSNSRTPFKIVWITSMFADDFIIGTDHTDARSDLETFSKMSSSDLIIIMNLCKDDCDDELDFTVLHEFISPDNFVDKNIGTNGEISFKFTD